MTARILRAQNKVLVVGCMYDQLNKFDIIKKILNNYQFIIINGNILYPETNIEERINLIDELLETGKVVYNNGNYDLLLLKNEKYFNWLDKNPNIVIIQYPQTTFVITSGGVSPEMNKEMLLDNIETSFISLIKEKSWHLSYGGGYGYIISNNPLTENPPEFYNFSAQIGNKYNGAQTKVYAQEIDQFGLKKTILL